MIVQMARLRSLPVVVVVPVASRVRTICDMIRDAQTPPRPVVAASCGGTLYVVDGFDTLEAYRICGVADVECVVVKVQDVGGAVGLHLGLSRRLPTNPFSVIDAIRWMREGGISLKGVDRRHVRLAEIRLADDVRTIFETWLARMARRLDSIPPFWHILEPLSRIDTIQQGRALESVMAFVNATGTTPDTTTLRNILKQFASEGRNDHVKSIEREKAPPVPLRQAARGVPEVEGASRILCDCGREWYVDSERVHSIQESDSMVVLTGQEGGPVYPVPRDVAEHMDMGNSPVYHYVVPGGFPLVLVSGRRLDDTHLEGVYRAVRAVLK